MSLGNRGMIRDIVDEILMLSPTEQVYLARLWARGSLGLSFRRRRSKGSNRGNKKSLNLLLRLGNEFLSLAYMDKDIEDWMESRFASSMDLFPSQVAEECCYYKRFRREMMPWLIYLARKVKKKLRERMKKAGV